MFKSSCLPRLLAATLLVTPAAGLAGETALLPIPGDAVALDYRAYKGGFRVMELQIGLDLSEPGAYRMSMDAELVGAPALIFSYELAMRSEGRQGGEGLAPQHYRQEADSGDKDQVEWLDLAFDARGVPQVTADPDPAEEPRGQVIAPRRKGAQDLLTATLEVLRRVAFTESCDTEARVFDGRRLFDVVSEDQGTAELREGSINIYSGPARLCALTVRPLAGYRFDGRDKKNLPEKIELYLGRPSPELPEVPVRLVVHTGWGAVLVHLVGVSDQAKG